MDDISKYRVATCAHTKREVVQIYKDDGEWLCLHRDTQYEDADNVAFFKAAKEAWEKYKNA